MFELPPTAAEVGESPERLKRINLSPIQQLSWVQKDRKMTVRAEL